MSAFGFSAIRKRASKMYPKGTWYGAVDGHSCTAPCRSQFDAVRVARSKLEGGGYLASVLTLLETFEGRLAVNGGDEAARAGVADMRKRLEKIGRHRDEITASDWLWQRLEQALSKSEVAS